MRSLLLSRPLKIAIAACSIQLVLTACGANTEGANTASTVSATNAPAADTQNNSAPRVSVMTAFTPVLGSGGNGAVMTELKNHGGQLREPDARYDVFDTESTADIKTLKQNILASLDRDRSVLIDSDGTPASRQKAAQMSYEAIGGSLPDNTAVLIRKAPEQEGGGFSLIPIYTKAEVAEQIAKGNLKKPEDESNSAENFFFEPPEKQP